MIAFKTRKTQKLLKILIGAAWIDGVIEPEERRYLHCVATELDLEDDPEIRALLSEIKQVTAPECYQWIDEYTTDNSNIRDYQDLLEKISGLIYSDGYVDVRETQLIEKTTIMRSQSENLQYFRFSNAKNSKDVSRSRSRTILDSFNQLIVAFEKLPRL